MGHSAFVTKKVDKYHLCFASDMTSWFVAVDMFSIVLIDI